MTETDIIIKGKTVSRDNVAINIPDFYKMLKNYLAKEKGYTDFNEKSYEESVSNGLKTTKIKLEAKKKIDDYTEFKIETSFKMSDYKLVLVKGKKSAKGNMKIEFDASLENDYKEKWEKGFFEKFLRGVYDKIFLVSHFSKLGDDVKEECLDYIEMVKNYLNMISER